MAVKLLFLNKLEVMGQESLGVMDSESVKWIVKS